MSADQEVVEEVIDLYVRLVKLTSGEVIICDVLEQEDDSFLHVRYPFTVHQTDFESGVAFMFRPWLPLSDLETFALNKHTVVTITTVSEAVQLQYLQRLTEHVGQQIEPQLPDLIDETPTESKRSRTRCRHITHHI